MSLYNQAIILEARGDLDAVLALQKRIRNELGNSHG